MSETAESLAIEASAAVASGRAAQAPAFLRNRALRASAWVVGATPVAMAIQFARSLILTRLLVPDAFGLMAIVGVVLQGIQMCSDVGVGPSIIKSERGEDPVFLQTAWTVQIVRGVALWLVCCALAWPAAVYYHEPALFALIPAAGLNVVIAGFNTTAWATHGRAMKRGRITIIANLFGLSNLVAASLAAWWLRSVWALVLGGLFASVVELALGNLFLPGARLRLRWDQDAVRELVHFGKWVFASTLLTFFAMQADKLMLGKLIPFSHLGVYSTALVLASRPKDLVYGIAGEVLFPLLAEKVREGSTRTSDRFRFARGHLLRIGLLLCFGALVVAPAFFHYLYDSRYAAAGWMAQLLVFSCWITILNTTTSYALLAFGDSKSVALGNLANVIVTVAAAMGGFKLFGLSGFIIGYALGTGAGEWLQVMRLRQHGIGVVRQDLTFTAAALLFGAVYSASVCSLRIESMPHASLMESGIGVILWACTAFWLLPPVIRELAPSVGLSACRIWGRGPVKA